MNAEKLFVDTSIEIDAPAAAVWDALTRPDLTREWVGYFGLPGGAIVSEWKPGSPVLWTDKDAMLVVEGVVTAVEPPRRLRFTVFDVRSNERPDVTDEDGITYQLSGSNGHTTLRVRQGDFSTMPDGAKYRDMSAGIWEDALAQIKTLAERGLHSPA